ncbi:MAG: molybdopterin-dependent oxidoreductase [Halioglobus sp.]
MTAGLSRRGFLQSIAASTLVLTTPSFVAKVAASVSEVTDLPIPDYDSWQDIYQTQWSWDKIAKGTHLINCWYQAHCAWDVFVKDGLVYREEQTAEYPQTNSDVPDFNPRGCQKGCSFSNRMYDATRVTHPLKRMGERGEGKWKRVSWDEALTDIADRYIDVTVNEGSDRTIWDCGPGLDLATSSAAVFRFSKYTRSVILDMNTEIGDGHRGALETMGKISGERSADDFFYSDLILIWGSNPIYTQIPNAHFYTEARYNGTKIITISPDYNASATKSDLWVPVKPGTDAALAMGIARWLVEHEKIDRAFMAEQTDMPLLVREDTDKFLTEADMVASGSAHGFYFFDTATNAVVSAPRKSLSLGELDPDLDASTTVTLLDGSEVKVRTVFSRLKDTLEDYTLANVSKICGTGEKMIELMAESIGNSKAMTNVTSSSLNKYFHGNLIERSMIMVFALTGNMGRHGAGYGAFPFLTPDGFEPFMMLPNMHSLEQFAHQVHGMVEEKVAEGMTEEMATYDITKMLFATNSPFPQVTSGTLFWAIHGGIKDLHDDNWTPFITRPVSDYVMEAVNSGDQPLLPPSGTTPRIIFHFVSNSLRRVRGGDILKEKLWPKLELSVCLDMRMNTTAQHSDYVLPCAAWYERNSFKWVTPLSPFLTATTAATEPLGESKPDWEIVLLLSEYIQKRAKERGIGTVKSPYGEDIALDKLYDQVSMNGEFGPKDEEKVAAAILDLSSNLDGVTWDHLKEKGFAKFTSHGHEGLSLGNMTDFKEGETIVPHTHHVDKKVPWPTTTRRMQFYIDVDRYLEMGETLPMHKEPPKIGGNHPFMLTGGHPRESIHSTWRDNPLMLQLTRGEPFILICPFDAHSKGIEDSDVLRVFNDVGEFHVKAKLSPSLQPGQLLIYHAWEDYQFIKGSMRNVTPSPINPVELVGNSGTHLDPRFTTGQPSTFDRDARVDVEKIEA